MTDREKLIALIRNTYVSIPPLTYRAAVDDTAAAVIADHLLASGVVVREKGEWQRVIPTKSAAKWSNKVSCPVCHRGGYIRYNFCPNCGADMRKEKPEA